MKKLKFLVGAVALFALVVANVWNAATTLGASELDITNVESMVAEGDVNGVDLPRRPGVRGPEDCRATVWYVKYKCGAIEKDSPFQVHRCSIVYPYNKYGWAIPCSETGQKFSKYEPGIEYVCNPTDDDKMCRPKDCRPKN